MTEIHYKYTIMRNVIKMRLLPEFFILLHKINQFLKV